MPHQRHGCSGARIGRKVYGCAVTNWVDRPRDSPQFRRGSRGAAAAEFRHCFDAVAAAPPWLVSTEYLRVHFGSTQVYVAGGDYTAPDGHFCSVFDLEDETWSVLSQRLDPALPSLTQLLGRPIFRNVAFQPVGAVAGRLVVLVEGLLFVFNPLRPSVGWRPASDASDASDLAVKKVLGTAAQGSCVWRDCLVVSRGRGVRGACAVTAFKFSAGPEDDDWHRGVRSRRGNLRRRVAAPPRLRRGYSVETSRGDAAAATWIFSGDESRRRRGYDVDIQWRRRRRGNFG